MNFRYPTVIYREVGQPCNLTLGADVPEDGVGSCIERLGQRRGEMQDMQAAAMGAPN